MAGIKLIPLNQRGSVAIIDANDWDKIKEYKWHLSSTGYAVWRGVKNGTKKTIRMHRLINETPENLITDHINRNRLDNRKSNLRSVTHQVNIHNKARGKGYWYQKQNNNWVVEIQHTHIGCFAEEEFANQIATMILDGELPIARIKERTTYCKYGHNKEVSGTYGASCKLCVLNNQRNYYLRKRG